MKYCIFYFFVLLFAGALITEPAFAGGLENLQSGIKRGTSALQKVGYVVGSLMFVIGAITMKFDSDRGKHVLMGSIVGIVLLAIGTSLPETLKSFFQ